MAIQNTLLKEQLIWSNHLWNIHDQSVAFFWDTRNSFEKINFNFNTILLENLAPYQNHNCHRVQKERTPSQPDTGQQCPNLTNNPWTQVATCPQSAALSFSAIFWQACSRHWCCYRRLCHHRCCYLRCSSHLMAVAVLRLLTFVGHARFVALRSTAEGGCHRVCLGIFK